ncbi:39256_t:CDS:1, partial [Gigaspora margarita]
STLTVELSFVSACRVYVTDCNFNILRDAGKKYCNGNHWTWDQAPGTPYCLHIEPVTEPQSNRYCQVSGGDACYKVD